MGILFQSSDRLTYPVDFCPGWMKGDRKGMLSLDCKLHVGTCGLTSLFFLSHSHLSLCALRSYATVQADRLEFYPEA